MEILLHKDYRELLNYLPHIKTSLQEWLFIDVHLTKNSDKNFTVTQASEMVQSLFRDKEGKVYEIGRAHV